MEKKSLLLEKQVLEFSLQERKSENQEFIDKIAKRIDEINKELKNGHTETN